MYRHMLVPLDGSPLGSTTIDQAIAYARGCGARLTFFHARPDLAATGEGALLMAMSPDHFAAAAAGNARAIVGRAETAARAAGIECASLVQTSDRPHEAILDAAKTAGCDMIFMASHGRRGITGALHGSVTGRVLQRTTLPVLVAAVESNLAALSDEQRALAMIRDEHRSLGAVLHALLAQIEQPQPVPALVTAMLHYVEQFPEQLHHPKEDAYLFQALRTRTAECNDLLDDLERQHAAGAAKFAAMRAQLRSGDTASFAASVRDFAAFQWRHMGIEERIVLPAASRHLLPADWKDIATAFGNNGDPRFGDESFERLAGRLLELAAGAQGTS